MSNPTTKPSALGLGYQALYDAATPEQLLTLRRRIFDNMQRVGSISILATFEEWDAAHPGNDHNLRHVYATEVLAGNHEHESQE